MAQYKPQTTLNTSQQYLQAQMKQRSTQPTLSDYYFAVYPVSLQFSRDYKTRFHLYFQKNLQIISKHESPLPEVKKDQIAQFSPPQSLNHFRIQNEKNLEYHWNLYIIRVDKYEQFIEGQKISLKEEWSIFKAKRTNLFEQTIKFNTLRCNFSLIVIIGTSNQQILDFSQKYFADNKTSSVLTTDQKVVTPYQNKEYQQKQFEKLELRVYSKSEQQNEDIFSQNNANQVGGDKIQRLEDMRISNIIYKGHASLQSRDTYNQLERLLSPREDQNLKLSTSQLQIGMQIQQKVNSRQNSLKGQPKLLVSINKNLAQPEEKAIRMTSSQILNEKREVIEPIYKQKIFIIVFFCLLALLIGSAVLTLGDTRQTIFEEKMAKNKKGKKPKQRNRQGSKKRGKGKK